MSDESFLMGPIMVLEDSPDFQWIPFLLQHLVLR